MEKDSILLEALGRLFNGKITTQPTKNSKKLDLEKYVNKSLSLSTIISDLEYEKENNKLPDTLKYLVKLSQYDKIDISQKNYQMNFQYM